jgi:hypothetical protein
MNGQFSVFGGDADAIHDISSNGGTIGHCSNLLHDEARKPIITAAQFRHSRLTNPPRQIVDAYRFDVPDEPDLSWKTGINSDEVMDGYTDPSSWSCLKGSGHQPFTVQRISVKTIFGAIWR